MAETTYFIQYPVSLFLSPCFLLPDSSPVIFKMYAAQHITLRARILSSSAVCVFFFLSQLGTNQFYRSFLLTIKKAHGDRLFI